MSSDNASASVPRDQLHRALGPRIATAVVVGSVIGSGIFLKPGTIAAASGNFGVIISVWVFGGVLCILGGLSMAELAAMLPRAGGMYVYLREAYGRPLAFLAGWNAVLFYYPASIGALAVAFVGSFNTALGWNPSAISEVGLSVALILLVAWINILGVLWGGRVQMVFTVIKAGFLALVALLPFLLIPIVDGTIQLDNYWSTVPPREPDLARQLSVVLLGVMWAYNGWESVTPLAEEIRDPQRNLPLALMAGIGILIVLYVSANVAYHGVLSMQEMAHAGEHAAEETLHRLLGRPGLAAMSAVIMCSTLGALNTNILFAPRITFAMARDGVFFRGLAVVHANYRTPVIAILLMAWMAILMISAVAVGKYWVTRSDGSLAALVDTAPSEAAAAATVSASDASAGTSGLYARLVESLKTGSTFDLLTNFVIFAASIFYVLGVFAVIVLRFRRPELERPYRTWGYPYVPLLYVAVYIWFLIQVYRTSPLESLAGMAVIASGVPAYVLYQTMAGRRTDR